MKNSQCEYDNDGDRITQPGKFEGEPVFAPYLWNLGLEGLADSDNGQCWTFKFTTAELNNEQTEFGAEIKRWLGRARTVRLSEDSQGFVHCF